MSIKSLRTQWTVLKEVRGQQQKTFRKLFKQLRSFCTCLQLPESTEQETTKTYPPGFFTVLLGNCFMDIWTKVELYGKYAQHCLEEKDSKPTPKPNMKNGRRIIKLPCCFRASLPGHSPVIKGQIDIKVNQDILQKKVHDWLLIVGCCNKPIAQSTQVFSADHKSVEMLWHNLKRTVLQLILLRWNIFVRDGLELVNTLISSHRKKLVIQCFTYFLHPTLWLITQ